MGILDWLFSGRDDATGSTVDPTIIDQRIEQVVRLVDPRLKLVNGYHRKLEKPVEQAILFCRELEAQIQPTVTASAVAWAESPLLRAVFGAATDIPEVFSRSGAVQDFFASTPGADAVYAVLRFLIREDQRFGMRVQGQVVQRDVAQTALSFGEKQVPVALATEQEARIEIRRRAFKFLVTEALDQISSAHTRRQDLREHRSMLQARLDMLRRHRGSMESAIDADPAVATKVGAIEEMLALNERSLAEFPSAEETLDYILKRVRTVLTHGSTYIQVKPATFRLSAMNIVVPAASPEPANEIVLPDVALKGRPRLALLVTRFPRGELIPRASLTAEAKRLLG